MAAGNSTSLNLRRLGRYDDRLPRRAEELNLEAAVRGAGVAAEAEEAADAAAARRQRRVGSRDDRPRAVDAVEDACRPRGRRLPGDELAAPATADVDGEAWVDRDDHVLVEVLR